MANTYISRKRLIFQQDETEESVLITYEKLWETMRKKGLSQYRLINDFHVSAGQLSRLRANAPISTHTVDMLCDILECDVQDIMTHTQTI